MSRVKELFGNCWKHEGCDWGNVVSEQLCPFVGKRCSKTRKSEPSICIGICTVEYGSYPGVMICPNRFLDGSQVFADCLYLLSEPEPGDKLHLVPEVAIPGGSVDYFIVSTRDGKVVDFVGVELQTMDTIGSLWGERTSFLESVGVCVAEVNTTDKRFGINWRMTAKTTLMQMHHKIETFESLDKRLVLVVQDCLADYLDRHFDTSLYHQARSSDSFHIHSYALSEGDGGMQLKLSQRNSTDSQGIALSLRLRAEAGVALGSITQYLEKRISDGAIMHSVFQ